VSVGLHNKNNKKVILEFQLKQMVENITQVKLTV